MMDKNNVFVPVHLDITFCLFRITFGFAATDFPFCPSRKENML